MADDERTHRLLEEIRDVEKESLAEYRRVTQQSLDMQRQATTRQQQTVQLYRQVLLIGTVIIVPLLVLLMYLLFRWSDRLFR
jgi:uncharacterized membrane protein affecting hemolysin expression